MRRHTLSAVVVALVTAGLVSTGPAPGWSDSSPQDPSDPATPTTVSADALPTVQINGVVWAQAMVGNRVYAGGSFSNARPAGSPSGSGTVPRANLLAYDIVTGALTTSFAPSFNAQVRAIAVSPDQTRIYVGGDFTTVNGVSRRRIAAFNASTGALIDTFNPPVNYHVNALAATNTTVYAGGEFQDVGTQVRQGLAAFNAANGALLKWAPAATGGDVWAMTINPSGTRLAVGGSFTALNGSANPGYGLGMVDATTGASLPFAANSIVRNGTADGAITTLTSDDEYVYGGGYTFGRSGGSWEGTFSAAWEGGTVRWANDCHGDTYSLHAQGDVVYAASHTHYCENIDGIRQGDGGVGDYPYFRGMAFGKQPTGTVTWEPDQGRYYSFLGQPRSSVLTWYPNLNAGTYTGQIQGPWSVTGNADYVAMGGEFTRVNGQSQQGLVRFARTALAPNDQGPSLFNATYPLNVSSTEGGKVRINWTSNEDIDNDYLTYRVYRDVQSGAGLIHTRQVRARWWNHLGMGVSDTGLVPGSSHRYRVAVTDPFGNIANSPWTDVVVAGSGTDSPYVEAVQASEPTHWWRLDEQSGTFRGDAAGFRPLTTTATGVTPGVPGALTNDPANAAARFNGATSTRAYTTTIDSPPDVFTLEAWFRTTSTTGGKIVGRGNRNDRNSSKADRHLYLNNAGQVLFGVKPDQSRQVVTSPGSYRDGAWHQAVASLSPGGMRLYVDGALVAQRADVTTAEHLARGYWRVGGDALNNWPSAPSSAFLDGDIDEVAIYKRALSDAEVVGHYAAGTGAPTPNVPPVADFTASPAGLTADLAATASDPDGSVVSYAWSFGDGETAPASPSSTTSHTYAAAGTYDVTLTVTDDDGAHTDLTKQVQVSEPPAGPQPFALDAFSRQLADGWGSADLGGPWTRAGAASNFSVADGLGRIRMSSPGTGPAMALNAPTSADTDLRVRVGADKAATGGGTYLTIQPRLLANGSRYYADVRLVAGGSVSLILGRTVSGTDTTLLTRTVPGLTVGAGDLVQVRAQAFGTSPTTLRVKLWPSGTEEPEAWTSSLTDDTAGLQVAGGLGLRTYLSGSATNAPVLGLFDDLSVSPTQ
ncbi:LamG-like jellyroll fold domain-containing protein [Nocardioides sp. cx-173]|uniref:LamG-like jellyroll fold domain-containing protein n=1 Tax=Nocardioides sp. cx-173 TaxID=2898796 RepID=UPI001E341C1C|nr:LamG-like jellyroll fold domain-containing protein [Nocardioides sp. cx-173]MCD4526678.1 PKD domain-containing protein [Nocardioides sp. cx-173]UGB42579.1 PKD domain-containing protein [Nocardioides sp. cx-173]